MQIYLQLQQRYQLLPLRLNRTDLIRLQMLALQHDHHQHPHHLWMLLLLLSLCLYPDYSLVLVLALPVLPVWLQLPHSYL